jgi:predicted DNA-binding protein (UPF0251 family)
LQAAAEAGVHAAYEERLERFRLLDRDRNLTDYEIASYMGVSRRSVWRYRAAERAAGQGWWKNGKAAP